MNVFLSTVRIFNFFERDLRIKKLSLGSLLLRGKHLTGHARHTGQKIDSGPAFGRWAFEAQGSQTMCWQLRRWSRMDWSADEGPLKQARQRSQEDILGYVRGPVQPYFLASFPSFLGHRDTLENVGDLGDRDREDSDKTRQKQAPFWQCRVRSFGAIFRDEFTLLCYLWTKYFGYRQESLYWRSVKLVRPFINHFRVGRFLLFYLFILSMTSYPVRAFYFIARSTRQT